VAGRVNHVDQHVADLDTLLVHQRLEWVVHPTGVGRVQAIGGAGQLGQLAAAGIVVGMDMRIDHMGNLDVLLRGLVDEPLLVAEHRVDSHADMAGTAAEEIGQGGVLGQ